MNDLTGREYILRLDKGVKISIWIDEDNIEDIDLLKKMSQFSKAGLEKDYLKAIYIGILEERFSEIMRHLDIVKNQILEVEKGVKKFYPGIMYKK